MPQGSGMGARPRAIIFDIFNTLFVNSLDAWLETFDAVCDRQGLRVAGIDLWEPWRRCERAFRLSRVDMDDPSRSPPFKTYEAAWAECFERVFERLELRGDAGKAAGTCVESMAGREPFPETEEALDGLAGRVRLGVFSNADDRFLLPLLERYDLPVEAAASSESARVYKPDARAFEHILGLMDLAPEEAWYVGDSPFDDILGARRAGMRAVWIDRRGVETPSDPAPDATITDLRQLSRLLDRAG